MRKNHPSEHMDLIYGRKPVLDALETGRLLKVFLAEGVHGAPVDEVILKAKAKKIPFLWIDRRRLDGMVSGHHQGVVAQMAPIPFHSLAEIIDSASRSTQPGAGLLFLDGIQDPQNVGSILRSAYFFGVKGVVIPKWRAASVTGAVVRASAGAAAHIPIAQVANLGNAIEEAKKKGIWIVGADMTGQDVKKGDIPRPCGLVLGSEGDGLHQLVREKCDLLVKLTRHAEGPAVDSLNVGAAAAAFLHFLS